MNSKMSTDTQFDPETGEIREPGSNAYAYSVTEISQALKRSVEDLFGHVRIRGEITGYKGVHSSGHCYFSIKDAGAKIDAVIWRGQLGKLRAKLQEGLEVIVTGKLTTFPGKSSYQVIVETLEPAGAGALMALLEQRKKKLAAEGLFDADRKRPLPYLPEVIGVVTSPTGAVIRDILHRLQDRFPRRVIVWPVRVQGESAAGEIAAAINGFNSMDQKPDLLIIARGGGSIEDLWAFNEEIVLRAAAASKIPLISAVGHETDTTLIDFVSDWRAPTPTAAAERAVPVRADLVAALATLHARQNRAIVRTSHQNRLRLQSASRALLTPDDILATVRQRLDNATARLPISLRSNLQRHSIALVRNATRLSIKPLRDQLSIQARQLGDLDKRRGRAMTGLLQRRTDRFTASSKLLSSLSYRSILARGFVLVKDVSGKPVRLAKEVQAGRTMTLEFADDAVNVVAAKPKDQGSLF
jgi:exodeoxyribonuclease VII large subunit